MKYVYLKKPVNQSVAYLFLESFWLALPYILIILGLTLLLNLTLSLKIFNLKDQFLPGLILAKNISQEDASVLGESEEIKPRLVWEKFYLSVPSIGLEKVIVTTDVESDLKETYLPILKSSIAHYKGTAYPGEEGNVFLYGHSVLPEFFNSQDYLTIFSNLDKINLADEIFLYWGVDTFKYKVISKEIIDPNDLRILSEKTNEKILILMSCVPPGTYFKRLAVKAVQVN